MAIAGAKKADGLRIHTPIIVGQMSVAAHLGRAMDSELLLDELVPAFAIVVDTFLLDPQGHRQQDVGEPTRIARGSRTLLSHGQQRTRDNVSKHDHSMQVCLIEIGRYMG
jgi:hypothetical protein